jgi:hypothetical protein
MTIYARSDVGEVNVNWQGHEHYHRRPTEGRDKVPAPMFPINCAFCEAFLLETFPDQYASDPAKVPLTPDEQARKEAVAEEGSAFAHAIARSLSEQALALADQGGF